MPEISAGRQSSTENIGLSEEEKKLLQWVRDAEIALRKVKKAAAEGSFLDALEIIEKASLSYV